MNAPIQGKISRKDFLQWLESGGQPLQINGKDSYTTVIILPKTDQVDYLFNETNYRGSGIHWNDDFKFCGMYSRQDQTLRFVDESLSKWVAGLTPEECMEEEDLLDIFCNQVNRRVEEIIADDRQNLTIRELSSERMREDLAYYQKYSAAEDAICLLFEKGEPDIRFHSGYNLRSWPEDAFLAYLQAPETIIQEEAEGYIKSHQEDILLDFLENDALRDAYNALAQDTDNPIHRMRAITDAVRDSGAKAVTVTVQKDGQELTFKASAGSLTGHQNRYSTYDIPAADRREFERLFGRYADYTAEDIVKITYGRNTIYKAPAAPAEELGPVMQMGGM